MLALQRLSNRAIFAAVAVAAFALGAGLYAWKRPAAKAAATAPAAGISAAALYATSFRAPDGQVRPLGQFQGQVLVLNFWATWCAPCREEMPAFSKVHEAWRGRGVAIVGLSAEDPSLVARFQQQVPVSYPLWTGGPEVGELSRRLGNHLGVLPHTVVFGRDGRPVASRVGTYTEAELAKILQGTAGN